MSDSEERPIHKWRVDYVSPNGKAMLEDILGKDPDDVCHQLYQRYGSEWSLNEIRLKEVGR